MRIFCHYFHFSLTVEGYDSVWLIVSSAGCRELVEDGQDVRDVADVVWGVHEYLPVYMMADRICGQVPSVLIVEVSTRYSPARENHDSLLQASREDWTDDANVTGEKIVCSLDQIVLYSCRPGMESLGHMLPTLCKKIEDGERDVRKLFKKTCDEAASCIMYNNLMRDLTL